MQGLGTKGDERYVESLHAGVASHLVQSLTALEPQSFFSQSLAVGARD
jgi:hypothetical protein